MQSETAISRELMGKIVDEVFDGAIEDRSVIEEIYAVIKREEAALSKVPEPKPLDLNITQDWFEKRSALEADHEIGAGSRKLTACIDPTPDELAELFKIAHRIPDGWQLVPVAALPAAEPVVAVLEFAKGTPGRENEMPRVLSCNWLPDGRYNVYLNPPAPSVSVNALEWVEETQYLEVWRARPDCGLVFTVEDDGFSASKYRTSVGQKVIGYFSALLEAKAAAQADYEARILSALSAQVQDVAGAETTTRFHIEWIAGARPPVHANPMTGRTTFESFERAVQHMKSQADDAQFVSLEERRTTIVHIDRSADMRDALPAAPAKQEG